MMTKVLVSAVGALCLVFALPVSHADTSIGLRLGTLGGGVELAHAFSETTGFRVSANGLKTEDSDTYDDVRYDTEFRLRSAQLLFDWYPMANNFRVSAGAMYNGNEFKLNGKPSGGTYTIDGTTYNASDIGSLDGKVDFRRIAPYAGVGYGRPIGKGLSFLADAGLLFQGKPRASLSVTCGASTPSGTCTSIQNSVRNQENELDDDVRKFRLYPVLSVGLAYKF